MNGVVFYGFQPLAGSKTRSYDLTSTLRSEEHGHQPIVLVLEHHPNDSRIKIAEDGICQALTQRMGTGGGNVPLVMVREDDNIQST